MFDRLCQIQHLRTLWQRTVFIINRYVPPSIHQLIASTPLPNFDGNAFSEAYQMSMSAIECPLNATGRLVQAATLLDITT